MMDLSDKKAVDVTSYSVVTTKRQLTVWVRRMTQTKHEAMWNILGHEESAKRTSCKYGRPG